MPSATILRICYRTEWKKHVNHIVSNSNCFHLISTSAKSYPTLATSLYFHSDFRLEGKWNESEKGNRDWVQG